MTLHEQPLLRLALPDPAAGARTGHILVFTTATGPLTLAHLTLDPAAGDIIVTPTAPYPPESCPDGRHRDIGW